MTGVARCDRRCTRATSVSDGTGPLPRSVRGRVPGNRNENSEARHREAQPRRTPPRERGAPGAGSVSFDPEAGVVTGLTRDRNSRSEYRCSMCSAIHISSRTSLRPSSTREPSDPPPRVVLLTEKPAPFHRAREPGTDYETPRLAAALSPREGRHAAAGR